MKNMRVKLIGTLAFAVFAFVFVGAGVAFATEGGNGGNGGGGEGGGGNNYCFNGAGNYPYCNNNVCTNGATNYPYCNNNVCTNGATNYPYCNNNHCNNGCSDYPHCVICPSGTVLQNGQCVAQQCTNGATNYPYCNNNVCTNGATNYPACNNQCVPQAAQTQYLSCPSGQSGQIVQTRTHSCPTNTWSAWTTTSNTCVTNTCNNGCNNYPHCNTCPSGYSLVNGQCVIQQQYCSNGATNFPYCNNNVCTNGATNYPYCNNNQTCPTGYVWLNGTCQQYINNNYCTNGATNYPYCNNNYVPPTYTYCNGVQYPAGYSCPTYNYENLNVSTTGASPFVTTATIYGYVNPFSSNATIWFDYGTYPNSLQWETTHQSTQYAGQFSAALSNLQCGTRYYYRAVAQNYNGVKYGNTLSFVTQSCGGVVQNSSTVITKLPTSVGYYSAQFNGSYITSQVNSQLCQAFFDYGRTTSLGKRTLGQSLYNNYTANNFSKAVSGLSPNTTYYYRAGVTCLGYTKFGNIVTFRTPTYIVKKVTYVPPAKTEVKTTATCLCDTESYLSLNIQNLEDASVPGKTSSFKITFKNVGTETLKDVVIRVILPDELTVNAVDRGEFVKGSHTVTAAIPMLPKLAEGSFTILADVKSGLAVGKPLVLNAYSNYTVPTVVKNKLPLKGEVTAYTISVTNTSANATVDESTPVNSSDISTSSSAWSWLPSDWSEWFIAALVFLIFIWALRYVLSAFNSSSTPSAH